MRKKTRKIKNQIILIYSVFIITLLSSISIAFYFYNLRLIEDSEYKNMQDISFKTMQQLEDLIKDMDSAALEVICDEKIMNRLSSESKVQVSKNPVSNVEIRNQLLNIESYRQIIKKKISRISVFNKYGTYITSKKSTMTQEQYDNFMQDPWIRKIRAYQGKKVISVPKSDYWDKKSKGQVFMLSRLIRFSQLEVGFVEIQQDYEKLQNVFASNIEDLQYILINDQNQLIHSTEPLSDEALSQLRAIDPKVKRVGDQMIHFQTSEYFDWELIVLRNVGSQIERIRVLRNMIFLAGLLIIVCSLIFITQISRLLTRPIARLIHHINQLDSSQLSVPLEYESKYDETNRLNDAFQNLYNRLNDSINESYRFQNMQIKAHFDVLQAQINPHFMYNTLGIIANMGDEAKQFNVSDACYSLIEMLRYTNEIDRQWATINDEIEHTSRYLKLMKKRYEHRLNYHIQVEEPLQSIRIPKLILQPMVENSLQHGFDHVIVDVMEIRIVGKVIGDRFEISISDNGSGFDETILESIMVGLDNYKDKILNHSEVDALTLGGMGILSTFARLYIFFADSLTYEIHNNEVGMSIVFGGKLSNEKGDFDEL